MNARQPNGFQGDKVAGRTALRISDNVARQPTIELTFNDEGTHTLRDPFTSGKNAWEAQGKWEINSEGKIVLYEGDYTLYFHYSRSGKHPGVCYLNDKLCEGIAYILSFITPPQKREINIKTLEASA